LAIERELNSCWDQKKNKIKQNKLERAFNAFSDFAETDEPNDNMWFYQRDPSEMIETCVPSEELASERFAAFARMEREMSKLTEISSVGHYHMVYQGSVFLEFRSTEIYMWIFYICIAYLAFHHTALTTVVDAWLDEEEIDMDMEKIIIDSYTKDTTKPRNIKVRVLRWLNPTVGVRHTSHSTGEVRSLQRRCEVQVTSWIQRYGIDSENNLIQYDNTILSVDVVQIDLSMVEQLLDPRVLSPGNTREQQKLRVRTKASTITTHDNPSCAALDNHGEFNTTVQIAEQLARRPTGALNMDF